MDVMKKAADSYAGKVQLKVFELRDRVETTVYENNVGILKVVLEKSGNRINYHGQGTGSVEIRFVNCILKGAAGARLEIAGEDSVIYIADAGDEITLEKREP